MASILSRLRNWAARLVKADRRLRDPAIKYLLDEVSDLRVLVRELAWRASLRTTDGTQTKESFSYQWEEIPEGAHLVGDTRFEQEMFWLISDYTDLPRDWFAGQSVLDAGCGNGRWSYAFAKLGAHITAADQSAAGLANLSRMLEGQRNFRAVQANLLQPLPFDETFDLVWHYGVAHHTGNTRLVVENVSAAVRPGGRLFLMIYGEPHNKSEFAEVNSYVSLRRQTQFMTFAEKVKFLESRFPREQVHGYFDAVSPAINDLHRFEEIEGWLRDLGFCDVRRTRASRNHHLVADRLPADA